MQPSLPTRRYCKQHQNQDINPVGYEFGTAELQKVYTEFCADPNLLDLTSEVALQKMCITAVLKKIKATKLEDMNAEQVSAVTMMLQDMKELKVAAGKLDRLMKYWCTPDQLKAIMEHVTRTVAKHVKDDEALASIITEFERLAVPYGDIQTRSGMTAAHQGAMATIPEYVDPVIVGGVSVTEEEMEPDEDDEKGD